MDQRKIRGKTRIWKHGLDRRTLAFIDTYPSPQEIYQKIIHAQGWPYKSDKPFYQRRDRALCALLHLIGPRISEALRLQRKQFSREPGCLVVKSILLSKKRPQGKTRFRHEAFLPLEGKRRDLSLLVLEYLEYLEGQGGPTSERLFKFGNARALQIVSCMLEIPCHWLRAYCENFLYDEWAKDAIAVSDYMKIDLRTLIEYLRKGYTKYPRV